MKPTGVILHECEAEEIAVKEMARAMCLGCDQKLDCNPDNSCVVYNPARRAVKAGYGNVGQAVKEFADKVKLLVNELVELLFDDECCMVEDCQKPDSIPCGSRICIEENKQVWQRRVDNLYKELYGE